MTILIEGAIYKQTLFSWYDYYLRFSMVSTMSLLAVIALLNIKSYFLHDFGHNLGIVLRSLLKFLLIVF
jgi:hypothetical protein